MGVAEIVQAIVDENPVDAGKEFDTVMGDKMKAAIAAQKDTTIGNMFSSYSPEENEENVEEE